MPFAIVRAEGDDLASTFVSVLEPFEDAPLIVEVKIPRIEIDSDFRLVAATNRNLEQMVERGQFREDLLFRLRSFVIELPPLRERPEDIQELARYYADRFCERYGLAPNGFSPEFINILLAYTWPGNVREFVHTMERVLAAVVPRSRAPVRPQAARVHQSRGHEDRVRLRRGGVDDPVLGLDADDAHDQPSRSELAATDLASESS